MNKRTCPAKEPKTKDKKGNIIFQNPEIDDDTCQSFGKGAGCMYWDFENKECMYLEEEDGKNTIQTNN